MVLHISHLIRSRLELYDYQVVMTRNKDEYVPLGRRAQFANLEQANVFVSVHCNAFKDPQAHGIETLHFPGSIQGIKLAKLVQAEMVEATGLRDRGIKPRGDLTVLSRTNMPAILVEAGFISNPGEEKLLRKRAFWARVADGVADGIHKYFEGS